MALSELCLKGDLVFINSLFEYNFSVVEKYIKSCFKVFILELPNWKDDLVLQEELELAKDLGKELIFLKPSNKVMSCYKDGIKNSQYMELVAKANKLFDERDWQNFHSPKNLAIDLSIEANEVLEHFCWNTCEDSKNLPSDTLSKVEDEIGDVMLVFSSLSELLGIDPLKACWNKIDEIAAKYPADKFRGSTKKYTHYQNK